MNRYLRLLLHTLRKTLTFQGRATRTEFLAFVVISQPLAEVLKWIALWVLPAALAKWMAFFLTVLVAVPMPALVVRRLHDFDRSGSWALILLFIALRSYLLDLLQLVGGWDLRSGVERVLSYADWLLFLPAIVIFLLLIGFPGSSAANRFGLNPRDTDESKTAGPGSPEPAA